MKFLRIPLIRSPVASQLNCGAFIQKMEAQVLKCLKRDFSAGRLIGLRIDKVMHVTLISFLSGTWMRKFINPGRKTDIYNRLSIHLRDLWNGA